MSIVGGGEHNPVRCVTNHSSLCIMAHGVTQMWWRIQSVDKNKERGGQPPEEDGRENGQPAAGRWNTQ